MNKVLSVLAVVAILGVSFYAGHKSFGSSLEYEHSDVIDVFVNKCTKGTFIGGCTGCKKCELPTHADLKPAAYYKGIARNYKAGGCSYFKDTFCTLCTSIRYCQQKETFCSTDKNQVCDKCDDGYFVADTAAGRHTCQKCKQCSDTEYVFKACESVRGGKDSDTVCKPCSQCSTYPRDTKAKRKYLTKVCHTRGDGVKTKNSEGKIEAGKEKNDSKCKDCRVCMAGFEYTQSTCESPAQLGFFKLPMKAKDKMTKDEVKLDIQRIGRDTVAAIQLFVVRDKAGNVLSRRKPKNTVCVACTGCMNTDHPDLPSSAAKRSLTRYATKLCKNAEYEKGDKKGLYKAPFGFSKCAKCRDCPAGSYITSPCDPGQPHKKWMCQKIKDGKVVPGAATQCKAKYDPKTGLPTPAKSNEERVAIVEPKLGKDAECAQCSKRPKNHWTVFPCNPKHTSDAVHQQCSKCLAGEYEFQPCTKFSDTICPSCPNAQEKLYKNSKQFKSGLQYCKLDTVTGLPKTQCSSTSKATIGGKMVVIPKSTKCGHWVGRKGQTPFRWGKKLKKMLPQDPDRCLPWTREQGGGGKWSKCGEWKSECKEDFFGQSCCYHKHPYSCGVITTRERSAKRMKYPETLSKLNPPNTYKTNAANGYPKEGYFAQFCMSLCSEFPDCLAVEIADGGTFADPAGTPDESNKYKRCFFKSAFTQDQRFKWKGAYKDDDNVEREGDPNLDCYSNTCRQNIYMQNGGKNTNIINYRVPKKKTLAAENLEIANKRCKVFCAKPANKGPACMNKCRKRNLARLQKATHGDFSKVSDKVNGRKK